MLNIGSYGFFPGQKVRCTIESVEIEDAVIHLETGSEGQRIWICHNIPEKSGSPSPNYYGYKYSWICHLNPNGTLSDGVVNLRPVYEHISFKQNVKIQDKLALFLSSMDFSLYFLFEVKSGAFDEFIEYEISPNAGMIVLKNDKKSVEMKISRFIRQVSFKVVSFGESLKKYNFLDTDIESIYNKFVAYQNNALELSFLSGNDLLDGYNSKKYLADTCNTLHKSCMTDKFGYLEIYKENPNQVQLAVLKIGDKIAARCLVWSTIDGKKFHDKIYYTHDWMEELMKKQLTEKSIPYIWGGATQLEIVQLEKWKFNEYPYVDSFFYFDAMTGKVCFLASVKSMRNTNGRL